MKHRAFALAISLLAAAAVPTAADPVRFAEDVTIAGERFRLPMQIVMRAEGATELVFRVTADMTEVQAALPARLSQVLEDSCSEKTQLRVDTVEALEKTVRLAGRLRAQRWRCTGDASSVTRTETFDQSADIETQLTSDIVDGCLVMRATKTDLRPDGLTGAVLNATGVTARIERDIQESLDSSLEDEKNCIALPREMRAFDAELTGGGFRALEEGQLGAVIEGRMDISATNFIGLIHLLGRKGQLGDGRP